MNKKELSFRPNKLVEEGIELSNIENTCIDIIFNYLNQDGPDDLYKYSYTVDLTKYAKYLPTTQVKHAYESLRKGFKNIYNRDYKWGDIDLGGVNRMLMGLSWNSNDLSVTFVMNPVAKEIIMEDRANGYTLYPWKYAVSLTSKYSKRVYYCLKRWADKGHRIDDSVVLRESLMIPQSYNYGNFKKILLESIAEINEKTDLTVNLVEKKKNVKGGSKVIGFIWNINGKDNKDIKEISRRNKSENLLRREFKKKNIESLSHVDYHLTENGLEKADDNIIDNCEYNEVSLDNAKDNEKKPKTEINSTGAIVEEVLQRNGYKLSEKDILAIQKSADKSNLSINEVKQRLGIEVPRLNEKKNIVGSLIFTMSDKYERPTRVSMSQNLYRGQERHYTEEEMNNIVTMMYRESGLIE